jgi:hypothetical protein
MRRTVIALACLLLPCLLPGAVAAQQPAPQPATPAPIFNLNDEQIRAVMQVARDNLAGAKLSDGGTVAPETPAEKAQELIPFQSGRRVVETGLLSGVALKCSVGWRETNFQKMMTAERVAAATPKALAYVELLHGVAMNSAQQQTKECPPGLKERITREINARWK